MQQRGLYVVLLGYPELWWNGEKLDLPQPKLAGMIAYLAVNGEVTRTELTDIFFNEPKSSSMRVTLHRLKALAGADDWLTVEKSHVGVKASTDTAALETQLQAGGFSKAASLTTEGIPTLLDGLRVKDADGYNNWLRTAQDDFIATLHSAVIDSSDNLETHTDIAHGVTVAQALLARDPLDESLHRAVMRLELRRGNREAALAQYEQCRRLLMHEMRVEPLEETQALLRDIEQSSGSSLSRALLLKDINDVPSRPERLIGRDTLVIEASNALAKGERILLHGFGGTGKTALAASLTAQHLQNHEGNALWLHAGHASAATLMDALARTFEAQQDLVAAGKDASARAETIRNLLVVNNITLLTLDDMWNASALEGILKALPHHLPLIVSARERHKGLNRFDVGSLARSDALELLAHHAQMPLADNSSANELCALLGDHAFAIRIAGVTLHTQGLEAQDLLEQIQTNPHELKTPPELAQEGRESVSSLLSVTLNAMSDAAHETLLAYGSMPTPATTPVLLSLVLRRSEDELDTALIELTRRGLTERSSQPGSDIISYRLHDLVYAFAKANRYLRLQTVQRACHTLLTQHKTNYDLLDAEIGNLLNAAASSQREQPELFINIMKGLVVGEAYFVARGHSQQSIGLLEHAVDVAEGLELIEDAHYLSSRLGDGWRETFGQAPLAVTSYKKALHLANRLENQHRQVILLSLIGITQIDVDQQASIDNLNQAYDIAKSSKDDFALSHVLQHLGYAAGLSDDFELARQYSMESVEVAKRLIETESLSVNDAEAALFFSLLNLGEAEKALGNFEKALDTRNEALYMAKQKENLLWVAFAYEEIGEMFHEVNKREIAKENYIQAQVLYKQSGAVVDLGNLNQKLAELGYLDETSALETFL